MRSSPRCDRGVRASGAGASSRSVGRGGGRAIKLDDLERALAAAEPSAVLVPPRVLRRVIKRDRHILILGRQAARQTTYVIAGGALGEIVRPSELGLNRQGDAWPETVYLLERPDAVDVESESPEELLSATWRRLFRAKVLARVRATLRDARVEGPELCGRVARLGRTEFEEARLVFSQDGWLLPPTDVADVYGMFAAHFLELTHFAPALLRTTFPAIEHAATAEAVFTRDVDPTPVMAETRLPGAPEVRPLDRTADVNSEGEEESESDPEDAEPAEAAEHDQGPEPGGRDRRLALRARAAADRGNVVRAAILWTRVASQAAGLRGGGRSDRSEARGALRQLARRLRDALGFPESDEGAWAEALAPLLPRAAHGFWNPEALFLFDLQRVCLDHERLAYRLDLVGWLVSLGRRPLKHPLVHRREVAVSGRLRRASRRLPRVHLERNERARLESLLRPGVVRAESTLRRQIRPKIEAILKEHWVRPSNLPEQVAERKLVEELLDQVARHGYLTLGDLRDAASRSDLKLPDVSGPGDFWLGGPLLKADRALASVLDGVHRRGQIYLRWLQQFSMLAFGTRTGRLLTRFVALPFGGAYLAMEGLQHLVGVPVRWLTGVEIPFNHVAVWSLVGLVALGMINSTRFRRASLATFGAIGRFLRTVAVDLPRKLLTAPFVHRLLQSRPVDLMVRFLAKPGVAAGLAWGLGRLVKAGPIASGSAAVWAFVAATLVVNTRAGQAVEEAVIEGVVRSWRSFVNDVVPGLFRLVMTTFAAVLDSVERLIYAVDEWLRYRRGESRVGLVGKALIGPVWFAVAYLARIYVTVLIEPQINPIKHFPVVTVSHKLILPMTVQITRVMEASLTPLVGKLVAAYVAWSTVFLLPGLFGFLVWELKSNWQLYDANRSKSLEPVLVGSHGETIERLLRSGFHSGTLPKTFARLRRARRAAWTWPGRLRPEKAALKQLEALHHVEEAVRRFIERDALALLAGSRALGGSGLALGAVRMATNRIRVELLRPTPDGGEGPPLVVDLEERGGILVGGVAESGWLDGLRDDERQALAGALTGLFKKSGVRLVQTPGAPVPPAGECPSEIADGLTDRPFTAPLRFDEIEVTWRAWVDAWEAEQVGSDGATPLAGEPGVLPSTARERERTFPVFGRAPSGSPG